MIHINPLFSTPHLQPQIPMYKESRTSWWCGSLNSISQCLMLAQVFPFLYVGKLCLGKFFVLVNSALVSDQSHS